MVRGLLREKPGRISAPALPTSAEGQAVEDCSQPPWVPSSPWPGHSTAAPGTGPEAAAGDHFRRGLNDVEHFHVVLPFVAGTVTLTVRFGVAPEI